MPIEFSAKGINELQDALLSLPKDVREDLLVEVMDRVSEVLKAEMQRKTPVRTGKLRDSIQVRELKPKSREAVRRAVGPRGVRYAAAVEFGTAHASAQPYMRPAKDAKSQAIYRQARDEIIEGIEDLAEKKA